MGFLEELRAYPEERVREWVDRSTEADVLRALERIEDREPRDFAALLSPAAVPHLEAMAQQAHRLTRWHFGRTIGLYAPIYISNICGADCTYCGYAVRSGNRERRRTLTDAELRVECEALASRGFQSVLLLTGEAPRAVSPAQIAHAVSIAYEHFPSVSVEVYALDQDEYAMLEEHGVDGVTLYMETYHPETYQRVHLKGKKKEYGYRLDALERAGRAGARRLGVGALLGLFDWRIDGFWTILHARYLQRVCWQSAVSMSFPRLLHVPERFHVPHLLTDKELVQLILAARLCLPEAGFYLSTRERAAFRDRLIPLGVTMMSAGSSTRPGGYAIYGEETLEQFEIEDDRSPEVVAEVIRRAGYDPVWKDFDRAFQGIQASVAE